MKDKTLYPFAGALVAAWDTLAMSLGIPKKQVSVKFHNVHFYSEPILHNQKRLKLTVQLHRGSGYFEVLTISFIIPHSTIMGNILRIDCEVLGSKVSRSLGPDPISISR